MKNIILILIAAFVFTTIPAIAGPTTLKWTFAHGNEDSLLRETVHRYSAKIQDRSGKTLKIETVEYPETWKNHNGRTYRWRAALDKIVSGEVQMAQVASDELADFDPLLDAMDLPFLFSDNSQVDRVLDGEVGQDLLKRIALASNHKLHAFAFTYSGGFRGIISKEQLAKASDYAKAVIVPDDNTSPKKIRGVIRNESFETIGSKVLSPQMEGPVASFRKGKANVVLAPFKELLFDYPYLGKPKTTFLSDDHMSVFTTVILMNEGVFQKLSDKEKKILTEELLKLAKEERTLFIKEADDAKDKMVKMGATLTHMNATEKSKLVAMVAPVYEHFKRLSGGSQLLADINKAKANEPAQIP